MIDQLSILTHTNLPLAKTWRSDGTISDYAKPKHFTVETVAIDSIHNLSALLFTLEKNPHSCIIRGKYTGDTPEHTVRRKEVFEDQPLHTFLAEIDKFRPTFFDPVLNPVDAIDEYITTCLPECFHGINYHWQLSNSAGAAKNAGILKAHIWFFLETPYTSAQLKAWIENNGLKEFLDASVCDAIQVHYTSAPVFEPGAVDPIPLRSGFVPRTDDTVDLALDQDSLAAQAKSPQNTGVYEGDDLTAIWLQEQGIAKGLGASGQVLITCPFAENHTDGKVGESDTTYLPARKGFPDGLYHCSHAGCASRESSEFESVLGSAVAYFDALPSAPVEKTVDSGGKLSRFDVVQAGTFARRPSVPWLIKGILPEKALFLFFGGSGDGKTFTVLDMMLALTQGLDWNGHRTKAPRRVVYICAEGSGGFISRLRAYAHHYKVDLDKLPLGVIAATPNFRSVEDVKAVAATVNAFGQVDVIIVDTLAQVTPGADENTGKDMGLALKHCDELKRLTNAGVGLIHHAGKDASKGARGWSGLKAPLDAEFSVSKDDNGKRKLWVEKMKDGRDGFGWGFSLLTVPYGVDDDGEDLNSCIVTYEGNTEKVKVKPRTDRRLGKNQQSLSDLFQTLGEGAPVLYDRLVDAALALKPPAGKDRRDRRKYLVQDTLDAMIDSGHFSYDRGTRTLSMSLSVDG